MRTTISVSLPTATAKKIKLLARKRGFKTTSDYIRSMLNDDDVDIITEEELLRLSKSADQMAKAGKLIYADSLADLLK